MTQETAKEKLRELKKEMEELKEFKGIACYEMDWMARFIEIQKVLNPTWPNK